MESNIKYYVHVQADSVDHNRLSEEINAPYLYDGLKFLQLDLEHFVFPLQLEDLLSLGSALDVILQLETLPPLHLALLLHFVQRVLQLVDL